MKPSVILPVQRWFYSKETATSLTEQPTCNICMHACPYTTHWTVISTKADLASTLVSSSQMLFGAFWTFRSWSRLQRLIVVWSFPQRVHFIVKQNARFGSSAEPIYSRNGKLLRKCCHFIHKRQTMMPIFPWLHSRQYHKAHCFLPLFTV